MSESLTVRKKLNPFSKEIVDELMVELHLEDSINEGVYDPGIFKAVFLAGGPGSGKSTVSNELLGVPENMSLSTYGLKVINSDAQFEQMLKQAGYGTKLDQLDRATFEKLTSDDPSSMRSHAKRQTIKLFYMYLMHRLGVIIDGTGHNYQKIKSMRSMLDYLGYDTYLIFINTSLPAALRRNRLRPRTIPEDIVKETWHNVQKNIGAFQRLFGDHLIIIDNSEDTSDGRPKIPKSVDSSIHRLITKPVENSKGRDWIRRELQLKNRLENQKESFDRTAFIKEILNEAQQKQKKLIGVYAGRFQPFGRHHYAAYEQLKKITGDSTYIATSNKTDDERSPFNFAEKKRIIQQYGIPGSRIVQTKSPYSPEEIIRRFDPKTTAMVVIYGEKDADRLKGRTDYYHPYHGNENKLKGYKDAGYYIIANHVSMDVNGQEMSGSTIRKLLGSSTTDTKKKQQLFKQIFGWFDKSIFNMMISKFERLYEMNRPSSGGILLAEGGAYGHMSHPFDDVDLTFGDLKNIIRLSLQGELDKESKVTEKLDGQALSISWKDGKLVAARNKGHLKNQGANAVDVNGMKQMFANRGDLTDAFVYAVEDLETAISALTDKQKEKVFANGKNFMAVEVVFPKTQNVVPYDTSMLVFHGIKTYDNAGNVIGDNQEYARMLSGMIRQVNQNMQSHFSIASPSFLTVPPHQDFSKKQTYFVNKVNALMNKFGLKDTDTVSVYHQSWWGDFISKTAKKMNYGIPNRVLMALVSRWAFFDKGVKKTDILKMIDNDAFKAWVSDFDSENHTQQVKKNMLPFELIFLELGSEILRNAEGFIAANPDKSVQSIRRDLKKAIATLSKSSDIKQLSKLKDELYKIQQLGGFDAIVPAEGLVFMYKGKLFKLTGSFAPINQLLGMLKYGD